MKRTTYVIEDLNCNEQTGNWSREQLLGHMDMDTREWFDGVLTASARKVVRAVAPGSDGGDEADIAALIVEARAQHNAEVKAEAEGLPPPPSAAAPAVAAAQAAVVVAPTPRPPRRAARSPASVRRRRSARRTPGSGGGARPRRRRGGALTRPLSGAGIESLP